jgi:hypothetical protein
MVQLNLKRGASNCDVRHRSKSADRNAAMGCRVLGLDINAPGIRNANQLARARNIDSLLCFEECDVSKSLRFDDQTFDAVFVNDIHASVCESASCSGAGQISRNLMGKLKSPGNGDPGKLSSSCD